MDQLTPFCSADEHVWLGDTSVCAYFLLLEWTRFRCRSQSIGTHGNVDESPCVYLQGLVFGQ